MNKAIWSLLEDVCVDVKTVKMFSINIVKNILGI